MATGIAGMGQLLADVQVTELQAGETLVSSSGQLVKSAGGGGGGVQMTPNSVGSTTPLKPTVWDGLLLEIFPGTLAPGVTAPDLWLSLIVDDASGAQNILYIDCSENGNVFPRIQSAVGRKFVVLGKSLLQAAVEAASGRSVSKRNMPLDYTGLKITNGIDFSFFSTAGFTVADFVEPPTVQLYGDVLDNAALAFVQANLPWDGSIQVTSPRRQMGSKAPFVGMHILSGAVINRDSWASLSGGPNQSALKVQRLVKAAFNNAAVAGTNFFALTNKYPQVGGVPGNVLANQDLGFDVTTGKAVILTHVGRRPGAGAGYFGLSFGAGVFSEAETQYGIVCTSGNPRVPFGLVQPVRGDSNLFYSMPQWGSWAGAEAGVEVITGETAAMGIAAQNGQVIAAQTDETAIFGISIS